MKNIKKVGYKLLAMLLCMVSAVGFMGCGGNKDSSDDMALQGGAAANDEKTIEVIIYDAGYGIDWFKQAAKAFMEKTDYEIKYNTLSEGMNPTMLLKSGPSVTTTDLFILGSRLNSLVAQGSKGLSGYDVVLEPLDDVYNSEIPGEGITIKEKMKASMSALYLQEATIAGETAEHYFGMPWTEGYSGIMYNKNLFDKAGLTGEPRTTDELLEYCATMLSKNITPFIYAAGDDYFEYCSPVWWAQYEGKNGIDNFYNLKISDTARPSIEKSAEVMKQEGLLEMWKVYENLLAPSNKYVYEYVESLGYTRAQAYFLGDTTGEYGAMMPCGAWLEHEMLNTSAGQSVDSILPMKTPIISALSDKMSYWAEATNYSVARTTMSAATKKAYDEKLRALVDYADGVGEKPSWATEADIALIKESRSYIYSGSGGTMSIPAYSTAKTGAKEFLKFLATNEALEIYLNNTNGNSMPYNYNYKSWSGYNNLSEFAKRKFDIFETSVTTPLENDYLTCYLGGLRYDCGLTGFNISITFGSQDATQRKTAETVFNDGYDYVNKNISKTLMDCGMI